MKAKVLAEILLQYPDSDVVIGRDGVRIKDVDVAVWTDNGRVKSTYTDEEVKYHKRKGNDIGPLRRSRQPKIRLMLPD